MVEHLIAIGALIAIGLLGRAAARKPERPQRPITSFDIGNAGPPPKVIDLTSPHIESGRCPLGDECPCWREGYRDGRDGSPAPRGQRTHSG